MKTRYVIVNEGMGGFLNPPGHAEHAYSVREYNVHGPEREQSSISLSYAAQHAIEWGHPGIARAAASKLAEQPGTFTPEWDRECYAYFANCYAPDGVTRDVGKCEIRSGQTPALNPEWHLAYLHVRSFFPDARPNIALIENPPTWGKVA